MQPQAYLLTDQHGLVLQANDRVRALLGTPSVAGSPMADFLAPEDHAGLRQQLARADRGEDIHAWEVRLHDGASEPRVLVSIDAADGPDGRELRWVLWDAAPVTLVRDRLTKLLDDARGDVATLQALAEWQATLLGAAARDMRTPLQVVGSTIEELLDDGTALRTPVATAMLTRALEQVQRLRHLLPTLLQLGRLQLEGPALDRQEVDLRAVADEVLHDLDRAGLDVTFELAEPRAHADPQQLARVLLELVTHALAYGPTPTRLRLGSVGRGIDVELHLDVAGYDMVPAVREAAFSPFPGTGRGGEEADGDDLGLSLVTVFARLHGGRAWVEDAPRGGTSFRVLLSNALPDAPAPA